MKIYTLHSKQQLPITTQQAWDFLSDPNNLKIITPKNMGFIKIWGRQTNICGTDYTLHRNPTTGHKNKMGDRNHSG